ncbi:MAG TPA: sigma-70 family RNA polymerase sigma factor [Thermomicrobiales bacterium]
MRESVDPWSDEDEQALAVCARTDRMAFGVLYDRYVARVYGYCYRRLTTPEEAEDATSLVFTRALAALPRYRDNGPSFAAWLFAIAHNVVVDELRARRERDRGMPWSGDGVPRDVDPAPGPEENALFAEDVRELRALVSHLPAEQAQLIELRLAGLTDKEIAFVLGRSHGAVRVAQYRAVRRLRTMLGREAKERRDA